MIRLGITGHQEMPSEVEDYVKLHLDILIGSYDGVIGIGSLAMGADQFFAETVLSHGGSLEIIIPAENYRSTFNNESSAKQYDALLAKATTVVRLPYTLSSEEAYMAAGEAVVRKCEHLIAVWDGQPSRGKGGTGDVVELAKRLGIPISIVWPQGKSR